MVILTVLLYLNSICGRSTNDTAAWWFGWHRRFFTATITTPFVDWKTAIYEKKVADVRKGPEKTGSRRPLHRNSQQQEELVINTLQVT